MKDKRTLQKLRELLWRRHLSEGERALAASQPEILKELAAESRLNAALDQLPVMTPSSNFTTRVLRAVEQEEARSIRMPVSWFWPRLLPRLAMAMAILVFVGVFWQRYEVGQQRLAIAQSLALVAGSATVPGVDALNNYDAIQRMGQTQAADETLLALMQ